MVQTIYGLDHDKKDDSGKVINDSVIAVGSVVEICKATGLARVTVLKWLNNPPQGFALVRLFKEVY